MKRITSENGGPLPDPRSFGLVIVQGPDCLLLCLISALEENMLKNRDSPTESSVPSNISILEYDTQYTFRPLVHA